MCCSILHFIATFKCLHPLSQTRASLPRADEDFAQETERERQTESGWNRGGGWAERGRRVRSEVRKRRASWWPGLRPPVPAAWTGARRGGSDKTCQQHPSHSDDHSLRLHGALSAIRLHACHPLEMMNSYSNKQHGFSLVFDVLKCVKEKKRSNLE